MIRAGTEALPLRGLTPEEIEIEEGRKENHLVCLQIDQELVDSWVRAVTVFRWD